MTHNGVHRKHVHNVLPTTHIRKVSYLLTHDLVRCECGFYGWIEKDS